MTGSAIQRVGVPFSFSAKQGLLQRPRIMHKSWSLLSWSLPIGRIAGVDLRAHWMLPLVLAWLFSQYSAGLALMIGVALTASVLLHEVGHALAARTLGLTCEEILLWPLGGLANVEPNGVPRDEFRIAAAGPLVNAVLISAMLPIVALSSPQWPHLFDPTKMRLSEEMVPVVPQPLASVETAATNTDRPQPPELSADRNPPRSRTGLWLVQFVEVLFQINWMLLLVNLLPVLPFDGGRMLKSWLSSRAPWRDHSDWMSKVAIGTGIVLALLGMLFLSNTIVMGLGFFILVTALIEQQRTHSDRAEEAGFMGYDFSAGYTSLERSSVAPTAEPESQGALQRWRDQRQATRQIRDQQEAERAEAELDSLLEKVHLHGMAALTKAEQQTLYSASHRLRQRGTLPPSA